MFRELHSSLNSYLSVNNLAKKDVFSYRLTLGVPMLSIRRNYFAPMILNIASEL
jgi:hypothetical protein